MSLTVNQKSITVLVIGDVVAYLFSLILTLAFRYGEIPSQRLLMSHIPPFALLITIFIVTTFSAGLYDNQFAFIRSKVLSLLTKVHIVNGMIGAVFFYFAPPSIAPKANLLIFFAISLALLFVWRLIMHPVFSQSRKQTAIIVGKGEDIQALFTEINKNYRYNLFFKQIIEPQESVGATCALINAAVRDTECSIIVADLHNRSVESAMPFLYALIFSGVRFIDADKLYESIFGRIPLSLIEESWMVENSGTALGNRSVYDTLKRIIDVALALLGGILSLVVYPFIYFAIKLEDKGPIFITQDRIGQNGKLIKIRKFRSMTGNDNGVYGRNGQAPHHVTRVGRLIRKTRLDELPQLWNVVRGDLSLVGPRPELPVFFRAGSESCVWYFFLSRLH
jgi:hypothetical protein